LGERRYRRVGHSHLQGARKRQADHDDGARQHADRDQSAFTVASHNKRAHPWLNGRAPPTKGQSTQSPEGRKEELAGLSMTTPPAKRVYPSSPKWGRRATGVSFKRPLKLAHCCFILATKDLPPASGVLPSGFVRDGPPPPFGDGIRDDNFRNAPPTACTWPDCRAIQRARPCGIGWQRGGFAAPKHT
jgi:hypothetical protein